MESESTDLNIAVGTKTVGVFHDVNPVTIDSDEDCARMLGDLRSKIDLTEEENKIIDNCITAAEADEGEDMTFGPDEILGLADLIAKYPTYSADIRACSDYLTTNANFGFEDGASDFLRSAFNAFSALGDVYDDAVKRGPLSNLDQEALGALGESDSDSE